MAKTRLSPGVFVQETDISEVAGITTLSVAAMILDSDKGPVLTPALVTSSKELAETFGPPSASSRKSYYSALAYVADRNPLIVIRPSSGAAYASSYANI